MEKYDDIRREVEGGNVRTAYLLLRENTYLKDEFIRAVENKFINPDFAMVDKLILYSNNSADIDIESWLRTMAFGSQKKLLIFKVEDMKSLTDRIKKQIQCWIDKPSKAGILIILSEEKDLKMFTNLVKCSCYNFKEWEIKGRIKRFAESRGVKIEDKAISFLTEVFDVDMYAITTEIEKLISFISPEKFIKEVDVRKMGEQEITCSIYNLTDAIGNKNLVKAIKSLDLLFELGDASAGTILWNIYKHLNRLLILKEKPSETFGLPYNYLQEYKNEAKKWEYEDILKAFSLLYEVDYGIKRGKAKPKFLYEKMIYEALGQ